jgi:hypothetical protein
LFLCAAGDVCRAYAFAQERLRAARPRRWSNISQGYGRTGHQGGAVDRLRRGDGCRREPDLQRLCLSFVSQKEYVSGVIVASMILSAQPEPTRTFIS